MVISCGCSSTNCSATRAPPGVIVRDYRQPGTTVPRAVNATLDELDALSGRQPPSISPRWQEPDPTTTEAQDSTLSPRGYRAMAGIPGSDSPHADLLVGRSDVAGS